MVVQPIPAEHTSVMAIVGCTAPMQSSRIRAPVPMVVMSMVAIHTVSVPVVARITRVTVVPAPIAISVS